MLEIRVVIHTTTLLIFFGMIGAWVIPYIKNECLTCLYGKEFIGHEVESGWYRKADTMKVIQFTRTEAKIYYVCDNFTSGNIYTFVKDEAGRWELDRWKTVWKSSGNVSKMMWPYFWHAVYGRI